MKKAILDIALLTSLTTLAFAGEIRKEKRRKKLRRQIVRKLPAKREPLMPAA
jgi:hypothetical protein